MNKEEVICMAREAGLNPDDLAVQFLARFAALVAAAEREAILAIANSHQFNRMRGEFSPSAHDLAAAIRARGAGMNRDQSTEAMFGIAKLTPENVRAMIDLAVRAEREACAKVCDPYTHGQWFAAHIRARTKV